MSIIKHVTLQKIVAHDFRYDPHSSHFSQFYERAEEVGLTEKLRTEEHRSADFRPTDPWRFPTHRQNRRDSTGHEHWKKTLVVAAGLLRRSLIGRD